MSLADKFFEIFGKWPSAEACTVEDLPFASDIRRFLDEQERALLQKESESNIYLQHLKDSEPEGKECQ